VAAPCKRNGESQKGSSADSPFLLHGAKDWGEGGSRWRTTRQGGTRPLYGATERTMSRAQMCSGHSYYIYTLSVNVNGSLASRLTETRVSNPSRTSLPTTFPNTPPFPLLFSMSTMAYRHHHPSRCLRSVHRPSLLRPLGSRVLTPTSLILMIPACPRATAPDTTSRGPSHSTHPISHIPKAEPADISGMSVTPNAWVLCRLRTRPASRSSAAPASPTLPASRTDLYIPLLSLHAGRFAGTLSGRGQALARQ